MGSVSTVGNKVFDSVTILDLTRYLPGGYSTQVFADFGAKVIKVEDTNTGDFCRREPPLNNGASYYFTALGRNKKSISINLKNSDALQAFYWLVHEADVVIESFRPGVTKNLKSTTTPFGRSIRSSSIAPCRVTAKTTLEA